MTGVHSKSGGAAAWYSGKSAAKCQSFRYLSGSCLPALTSRHHWMYSSRDIVVCWAPP